jgi:NTP pyrophosphatase (non-canonical NTP hydrolase)
VVSSLFSLQDKVNCFRNGNRDVFKDVDPISAWMFLMTEFGELSDAMIRSGICGQEWLRGTEREARVVDEMGDVLFMLISLASALGLDIEYSLNKTLSKFDERCAAARKNRKVQSDD